MRSKKRTTLKGLCFIWHLSTDNICHGKILGRVDDSAIDVYLLELFPLKGNIPNMLAIDLDVITDGRSFELYHDEAVCRAAFGQMTESQKATANPRLN